MSEFLTFDELIAIHHRLIEEFGGSHGLIDIGALESALMRPQIGYDYRRSRSVAGKPGIESTFY